MLKSLNIENIAVIEKCNIDFGLGFNVLSGETGAGKSIVIDSINAVTGQRTSKELVRTGCDKATVSAVFDAVPVSAVTLLNDYGITVDDGSVMVLRTINADGRNTCKINGTSVNVSLLRELGNLLVNIHGQHDNQALLDPKNHCGYIDMYGVPKTIIDDYRDCYNRLKAVKKQLKALKTDEDEKTPRIDLLKYQINEIEAANVKDGELQELLERRNIIRNSEKLILNLGACSAKLSGNDDEVGAANMCFDAVSDLLACTEHLKAAKELCERLSSVSAELEEIANDVKSQFLNISFDPGELEECEQRIDILNKLIKKYGGNEEAVLKYLNNAANELELITSSDAVIAQLEQQCSDLEDELVEKGSALTEYRINIAENFSKNVCEVLKYLEMPNVSFSAQFSEGMYTVNGCDEVEFYISANSGQASKPLSKVASGGELSRIMLSIKSVMTQDGDAETLIFDEIDTGISGKAADKVGRQLKKLSVTKQVICVTHLAQIAAAADDHLLISKSSTDNSTYTNVEKIDGDNRIKEIARIMSGSDMTKNLYNSAKELIENHNK